MRTLFLSTATAIALTFVATAGATPPDKIRVQKGPGSAVALMKPTGSNTARGTVTFSPAEGGVRVLAALTGVPPGKHGFHVHERGDCRGNGDSALGHYNPETAAHGLPGAEAMHVGDLGNIAADSSGRANMDWVFPQLSLQGPHSILGRGLILHANSDDGGQPAGNAGPRIACAEIAAPPKKAKAVMNPTAGNTAHGTVEFTAQGKGVLVKARFENVPPGDHGFHIHEYGDCRSGDALSAGGHFNPAGAAHGLPGSDTLHVGDLGNAKADAKGLVRLEKRFDHFSLHGPFSILGRGVILHAGADDGGQPVGNAGARIACGEIAP